jgi:hypothetical protein
MTIVTGSKAASQLARKQALAEAANERAKFAARFHQVMRESMFVELSDPAAWEVEAVRQGAERVPWPAFGFAKSAGGGLGQLLRRYALDTLERVGDALADRARGCLGPAATQDEVEQLVLRMVKRGSDLALSNITKEMGGTARAPLKREFLKWAREADAEAAACAAIKAGASITEAIAATGIPRSTAYKAIKRAQTRRRK